MIDLALDKDTHDLLYQSNDLETVQTIDQIEQSLKERLLFYNDEWFLDTTAGVPYYDDVLVRNPNVPNIENILKAKIIDTDGVTELLAFDSSLDSASRTFTVTFRVQTPYGVLDTSVSLF